MADSFTSLPPVFWQKRIEMKSWKTFTKNFLSTAGIKTLATPLWPIAMQFVHMESHPTIANHSDCYPNNSDYFKPPCWIDIFD
jgi:hypothetical protein